MPKSKKYRKKPRGYRRKLANAPHLYNRHEPPQLGYAYNRTNPGDPFINAFHIGNRRYQDREKLESLKRIKNREGIQTGLMAENFKAIESAYYSSTATAERITTGLRGIHDEVKKLNRRETRPKSSVVAGSGVVRTTPPPIPRPVESKELSRNELKYSDKDLNLPFVKNEVRGLHGLTPPPGDVVTASTLGNFSVTTSPGARDAREAYEAQMDAAGITGRQDGERLAETRTPSPGATGFLARLSDTSFSPIESTSSPGFAPRPVPYTTPTTTTLPDSVSPHFGRPPSPINKEAAREFAKAERRRTLIGNSSVKELKLIPRR